MRWKRALCAILSAALLSSCVPLSVMAAETETALEQTEKEATAQEFDQVSSDSYNSDDSTEKNPHGDTLDRFDNEDSDDSDSLSEELTVEESSSEEKSAQNANGTELEETSENISGNLINGGMATEYQDVVYYANPDDDGCLYADQNGESVKLTTFGVQYLNVSDDGNLYYTTVDGSAGLTKIGRYNIASGSANDIYAIDMYQGIKNLIVQDGIAYFISNGVVKSLELSTGTQKTLLNGKDGVTAFLLYDGGYAYSRTTEDGMPVVVHDFATMQETTVTQTANGFDVDGSYVYYANSADDYCLYRVGLDGTGEEKLSDVAATNIVAVNGKVYYKDRNNADSEVLVYDSKTEEETTEGAGSCTEFTVLPSEEIVTTDYEVAQMTEVNPLDGSNGLRAGTVATGEYQTWKQYDPRWADKLFPNGQTMKQIGCLVTSISICVVDSGVRDEDEFDPGKFFDLMNNNNGFDSAGNLKWFTVGTVIPEFSVNVWNQKLTQTTQAGKAAAIEEHLDAGRQVVVSVRSGGHWVAVDDVFGSTVSIFDPGYNYTSLFDSYDFAGIGTQIAAFDVEGGNSSSDEELVQYKTTDPLNYRTSPNGTLIGTLPQGSIVKVVKGSSTMKDGVEWYKIKIGSEYYYVAAQYLVPVDATVAATKVTLDKTTVSLNTDESITLSATITPSNTTDQSLTWTSSDKSVATVSSSGVVKGVKAGTATITVSTSNGKKATCKVTVTQEDLVKYKTTDVLNYRSSPSLSGSLKGTLTKGATVNVVGGYSKKADGYTWYKIKIGSNYYYAASQYLEKVSTTVAATSIKLNKSSASVAQGSSVTLTATVSPSNVTDKNVTWSTENKSVATVSSSGVVKGVKSGSTEIVAKTSNGKTDSCDVVVLPEKVTGLKAIKKTETTLKLTFNAVDGADGYIIYDAETGDALTTVSTQDGADPLIKTVTGLNPGETRKYKVRAYVTVDGTKYYGEYSDVYTKATSDLSIGQVTGLKAIKKTETTLKLTFNAVDGADGYYIYDAETGKALTSVSTQDGADPLTKTITGLNPGESRRYQVRAYVTLDGTKYYGAYSEIYTKATAGTPAVTLEQVTGLKAIQKTETTLKLTFQSVKNADGYEICDAETGKILATVSTQDGADMLIKTVTGLKAGEVRQYKVRAYAVAKGSTYYGFYSDVYTKATAYNLAQVTGLKAIKKTDTTLKLTFNAVDNAHGYEICDAETGKTLTTVSTQDGADPLIKTVTGLNPGETRKYKVRAYAVVDDQTYYGEYSAVYTKATASS